MGETVYIDSKGADGAVGDGRGSISYEIVALSVMRGVISEAHVPGNDGFQFYSVICG